MLTVLLCDIVTTLQFVNQLFLSLRHTLVHPFLWSSIWSFVHSFICKYLPLFLYHPFCKTTESSHRDTKQPSCFYNGYVWCWLWFSVSCTLHCKMVSNLMLLVVVRLRFSWAQGHTIKESLFLFPAPLILFS